MGRRGPKPAPGILKLARGNPGKRAIPEEAQLPPAEAERPAADQAGALTGEALKEYTRLRPVLIDAGVLTIADEFTFETYCRLVGEVRAYEVKCAEAKLEDAHRLGYTGHLHKLRAQVKQYAAELGVTPSSRASVKVAPSLRRTRAEAVDRNDGKRKKYFGRRGSKSA